MALIVLSVVEQRLDAVRAVLAGAEVIEVADRIGVPDIRGVPAVSLGGGVVLFTHDSTVTIFDDKFDQSFEDSFDDGTSRDLRSMAEALRPVSGPADITKPLPVPVNAPAEDLLDTIATQCGAHPGDHGW